MAREICLSYKRVNGDLCEGTIATVADDDSFTSLAFTSLSFPQMMLRVSTELSKDKAATCSMTRLERPDNTIVLDPQLTELLRADPLAAIKSMTVNVTIDLRAVAETALTVAQDALADTFGDVVYLQRKATKVTCPFCGEKANFIAPVSSDLLDCCEPSRSLKVFDTSDKWVGVRVTDLLSSGAKTFFLPRKWNTQGFWISAEELSDKYKAFEKERNNV